ncbi:hypothetical protein RUM44_003437 [Polyplax serrata]|uniref:Uncharacterized protein n=1 Tax=Polyplax serrata TaxID=468196 RepID=A0ABR1AGG4_POLSC
MERMKYVLLSGENWHGTGELNFNCRRSQDPFLTIVKCTELDRERSNELMGEYLTLMVTLCTTQGSPDTTHRSHMTQTFSLRFL